MIKLNNKNLILLICIFLPFTYVIGILITEISVLILTIYFFFKNKSLEYYKERVVVGLFFFSIYVALIAILKIDHFDLKISSIFYFRYILFSLSIYYLLNFTENKLLETKNVLFVIYFLYSLIFFDSFYQFLVGKNLFGYERIK